MNKNLLVITTPDVIEECLAESLDIFEKPSVILKRTNQSQIKTRKVLE